MEKGTANGTLTNMNGVYQIYIAPEASHLVFSYIGYDTQVIKIGKTSRINVIMQPSRVVLEEIVVVADYDGGSPVLNRVRENLSGMYNRTVNQPDGNHP